ncbi:UNKNOWN [Stylonychia lemnae]|uniref:Uncharacterized protein n=1 Tax=Stylonychia lemnae TaxID=5949 RepID=A0A078A6F2_STYLE|nr:UNKNOWN [Stylonychia lemnae]|eukprot:CDW77155.1 UNKNOWN [Stylonychia lemnae]
MTEEEQNLDLEKKEELQTMIVRGNYRYRPDIVHKSIRYYKCEEFKTQSCRGVWRINGYQGQTDEIGYLHIQHSVILEHHTFYKQHIAIDQCLDISLYNQAYVESPLAVSLLPSKRPVLNEETLFLLNIFKDAYRKYQTQPNIVLANINTMDMLREISKNHIFAELLQKYSHLNQWLLVEARHQLTKEVKKGFQPACAFVDVSHIKTMKHLQFGRDVTEALIFGQSKFLTFFASEWQINMLKTKIDLKLPQVILVDTFCKLKSVPLTQRQFDWECVINLQFLDYQTYKFYTLLHCISQSEKSETIPQVLDWCKKEFGEHVFNPTLLIIDGDINTFDNIHANYSKHVNIYVPFFGYAFQVLHELKIRSVQLRTSMIRVMMFYFKLLPFVDAQTVKNRYADIKRIFQTEINSDFWSEYERNFLKDDNHIQKWTLVKCEDSKLLYSINKYQEKNLMLIDEQIMPSGAFQDNLGQLIEGIQKLEQLQKDEFDQGERIMRWI